MQFHIKTRSIPLTLCLLFLAVLSQSCVPMKIRNELPSAVTTEHDKQCHIRYSISFSSDSYTRSFGKEETKTDRARMLQEAYIESTEQVLRNKGCTATYSQNSQDTDISIRITRQLQLSAFPQEWLCGCSFGVIPAWATREGEFLYTFDKIGLNKPHTYYIDTVRYCHILLTPFGFKPIYADELITYEKTLSNYVDSDASILTSK